MDFIGRGGIGLDAEDEASLETACAGAVVDVLVVGRESMFALFDGVRSGGPPSDG